MKKIIIISALTLAGCLPQQDDVENEINDDALGNDASQPTEESQQPTALDLELSALITQMNLNDHPQRDLPDIDEALPQLGKKLFFTKGLGGDFDSACVTCHHPALGGTDNLSLSVGVDATVADLLGPGRIHHDGLPPVPRNAPTVFNIGLWDRSLFHDSRVQSLNVVAGSNGDNGTIRTPDSNFNSPNSGADNNAGANLTSAQARFPVTSAEEMRGTSFEAGNSNEDVRNHLAARIGNYGEGRSELGSNSWLTEFQQAYGNNDSAENLITFDNIAHAIAEYERSMVFVDHPWQQYMDGNLSALTDNEKQGAKLFFSQPNQGGAGCAGCHSGQLFSDELHHTVAFPQIGPGKGDGNTGDDDFGRERETGNSDDRYRFRTASLLNIALTAPYGHSGSYKTLEDVVRHYVNPERSVEDYFRGDRLCRLDQFEDISGCSSLYSNAMANSTAAVNKLQQEQNSNASRLPRIRLDNNEVNQLVSFLEALTDTCAKDRNCLARWVPNAEEAADNHQLNAIDRNNSPL